MGNVKALRNWGQKGPATLIQSLKTKATEMIRMLKDCHVLEPGRDETSRDQEDS